MKIIVSEIKDHRLFGFKTYSDPDEKDLIVEVDFVEGDGIINIFTNDRNNTTYVITEEELNRIGFFRRPQ